MMGGHIDALRNPLSLVKDLLKGFSVLPTLSAAIFILAAFIGSGISSVFLPVLYIKNLGWEPETYSQVLGMPGTIVEFCGALLGGYLADRIGKRKIIAAGYGAYGLLAFTFGIFSDYWINSFVSTTYLIIHQGCISFGTVAVFSLFMQISWTRAAATMFTSYMAMANLSTIMGTRLAGRLDEILSYNSIFVLVGIVTILPLGLLVLINPDRMFKLKKEAEEL